MQRTALILILAAAAPAVHAADGDSIESLTHAVYEVISGPAGARDWVRFRSMFAEGARLINFRATPQGQVLNVMTPDEYAKRAGPNFEKNAFFEAEISRKVESFGNIATVFSTYASRRALRDKPFARGINSFQLVKEGATWKVMTILWDTEREGNPIPEKYLVPSSPDKVARSNGRLERPAPAPQE